ncbi:MAG TPA: carbon-nitrogen hydrolase family protein [Phycisphaerae bacterium]|nr:carbon-nitrogen hydrolase family protein [Phycisphaerae bacterium]
MDRSPGGRPLSKAPRQSLSFRIGGAQLHVDPDDIDANTQAIVEHVERARAARCDFVVFPEMILTGYHGRFDQAARNQAMVRVRQACKRNRICALVGAGHKPRRGVCYIQAVAVDDRGQIIGTHSKIVATRGDRRFCTPGRRLQVFHHKKLCFGCLICNDMWVTPGCGPYPDPRLSYRLAQRGARVVFHLVHSGSSSQHIPYHESNLQLRAREGGVFIATANAAEPHPVNCRSGIVSPDGTWLVSVPRRGRQFYSARLTIQPK